MITIFNRKELIVTYSMKRQSEIRSILANNNIKYHVKIIDRKNPSSFSAGSRSHTGTFGENIRLEYEYIIYVRKEDYDNAKYLISKISD